MEKQVVRRVSVIDFDVPGLDEAFPENPGDEEPHWRKLDGIQGLVQHHQAVPGCRASPGSGS